MISSGTKRSYIHRKKYLNESVTQIKGVLEFIRLARKDPGSPESSQKAALSHAQSIEAVCWFPHSRISPEEYQKIMIAKTQELCRMLLRNALPTIDLTQLTHLGTRVEEPQRPRRLPLPIFPGQPIPQENGWPFEVPGFEMESIIPFDSELRDTRGNPPFEGSMVDQDAFFEG